MKPERAILEANMGGDKKPSYEYFQSRPRQDGDRRGDAHRRGDPPGAAHDAPSDLEALSWAGTHGAVASGMQSVAFTPASAIAAVFAATGQDLGMVGTSSMAHGTGRRVEGGLHASIRLPRARGRHGRRRDDASRPRGTGSRRSAAPGPARCTASPRSSPRRRSRSRSRASAAMATAGSRELLPGPPRARRPQVLR